MTKAIAFDARPCGVLVFALRPGSVRTALLEHILHDMGAVAGEWAFDV